MNEDMIVIVICITIFVLVILMIMYSFKEQNKTNTNDNLSLYNSVSVDYTPPTTGDELLDAMTTVKGGWYRGTASRRVINKLKIGDAVYFLTEDNNPYDRKAVMVISSNGYHIGYIPKEYASIMRDLMSTKDVCGIVDSERDERYEYYIYIRECDDSSKIKKAIEAYKIRDAKLRCAQYIKEESNFDYKSTIRSAANYQSIVDALDNCNYIDALDKCRAYMHKKQRCDWVWVDYRLYMECLHANHKYEEEIEMLDESKPIFSTATNSFWKRREFHLLRAIGVITSDDQIENEKEGIVTTVKELDGFIKVVDILTDTLNPNRLDFRDSKSYFSIIKDNKATYPVVRLFFNDENNLIIGIPDENYKIVKHKIDCVNDIDKYASEIKNVASRL